MLTKSKNTIAKILDASRKLFLTRSYADVTMAGIAQAAELTKGALYHHFASKEELYRALLLRDLAEKEALFAAAADSDGSCRVRLGRLTRAFYEMKTEKRRLMRLVRRDINVFLGETREEVVRAYQRALPVQVERILRDGIAQGEIRDADPRLLAWQFVAMVEVVLSDYAKRVLGPVEARIEHVLSLFMDGAREPRHERNGVNA